MAENSRIFLKLTSPSTGVIKGECTADEYEDWIELDSWNWSMARAKDEDATAEPSLLTISKLMDKSSTAMLNAMRKREQLRARLVVDDGSDDVLFELAVALEHVVIKDYSFSTQIGEKGATIDEEWVLDYRWITFEHQPDSKSGVKSIKLTRPLNASSGKPSGVQEGELRKLGLEMLKSGEFTVANLDKLWADIKRTHEEEKNRPDGKSLAQGPTEKEGKK